MTLPIPRQWVVAGNLAEYGDRSGTYTIPIERVPRLVGLRDDLAWLRAAETAEKWSTLDQDENRLASLPALVSACRASGLQWPKTATEFLAEPSLQQRVPTCTACFLELPPTPYPLPDHPGHVVVRVVTDSQACSMWYLLLSASAPAQVIASPYFLEGDPAEPTEGPCPETRGLEGVVLCADSFSEFLYRFWIENRIWFRRSRWGSGALTAAEQRYAAAIVTGETVDVSQP